MDCGRFRGRHLTLHKFMAILWMFVVAFLASGHIALMFSAFTFAASSTARYG